jgi:hypothetical protein
MPQDQQMNEANDEVVIDENNFDQYFFDVRMHKPKSGQVMARYAAVAEFVDGMMKKNIIDLLKKDKAIAATQVLRKLGCATEKDSVRLCKEICEDMLAGLTDDQIEQKSYRYTIEVFYYTEQKNIPLDDPHWSVISIRNLDDFLDADNNVLNIKATIVENKENKDD